MRPGSSVAGGADALYYLHRSTDTALLRLRRPPPRGAAFADWNPALPPIGTDTVGLHHSLAGPQQLITARVSQYKTCVEVANCGADADPDAIGFLRARKQRPDYHRLARHRRVSMAVQTRASSVNSALDRHPGR